MLCPKSPHLVINVLRLDRTATGAVDSHHNTLRTLVLESSLQSRSDALRAGVGSRADDAADVHQRCMFSVGHALRLATPVDCEEKDQADIRKGQQLEKDAPATRAALLADRSER